MARIGLSIAALAMAALPAQAHHSASRFDRTRTVTLSGVVRQFQWNSPHCGIELLVAGRGAASSWSIEMGAPAELYRAGWSAVSVRPGDKITIVLNPARDGGKGGLLVSATSADGAPIGGGRQAI